MRPLRIPGIAIMQADQPGRAVRELPAQPGPGLGHDGAARPIVSPSSSSARRSRPRIRSLSAAGRAGRPLRSTAAASAAAVLARSASSPVTRAITRVLPRGLAWPGPQLVRDLPDPPRRPSRARVRVAPTAACTRRTVRAIFPTALASGPESVG